MTECNCLLRPKKGRDDSVCDMESPDGNLCSKPFDHDGRHAACNAATHPVEVWERD